MQRLIRILVSMVFIASGVVSGESKCTTCCSNTSSECPDTICSTSLVELLSAEENNDVQGIRALAEMFDSWFAVMDKKKAADLYLKLAESGDGDAMFRVGRCYREGKVFDKNNKKAIEWFTLGAMEKKNILCALQLVKIYRSDSDLNNDDKFALWQNFALDMAAGGNADSKYYVGTTYAYGTAFPRDLSKAVPWLERAAYDGSISAIYDLIRIYYGRDKDYVDFDRGRRWLKVLKLSVTDYQVRLGEIFGVPPNNVEEHLAKIEYGLIGENKKDYVDKGGVDLPMRRKDLIKTIMGDIEIGVRVPALVNPDF